MRSRHVDRFNHDTEADGYDADVADESNPVRDGYDATLDWVIEHAAVGRDDTVVDLGTGTGNLAARLGPHARLVCVDVSTVMLDIAKQKLPPGTEYVETDLLEFVDRAPECDAVVSTYAIHHLTADEKIALLDGLFLRLRPGGRIAIGDLMVADRAAVAELRETLAHVDVEEMFTDEFPWFVDDGRRYLEALGFDDVRAEQTGVLSWGLRATKP
ncbi:MAG: putative AdoMet-dependent methyltransferase [Actinomycetota bacterium]|jgi:putative AdoMet-dependent methyltransferase|nr:putative AdoMet-dependent methyltransferase [Actinomycetota bacterium]